ncbi:hypothetical protein Vadar_025244 [Vaccinium darrowii]|uniref:Uncharacterized protein n=1 Tax=Vaccinium darrowii TaxID=229202 RepID=A0ACB7YPQ2_9ERIC|nr:hypothetical protein Vadar_025244 [Vaccinium darrowii]
MTEIPSKVHFVLVHGIGGGGWCWYKVRTLLENSGYKVSCVDLKGAGIDRSDAKDIHTFDEYNQPLIDLISSLPDDEKVILVGCSAGGLNVTDATYKFGKKISLAIYLGATMLKAGFQTEQDFKEGVPNLKEHGEVYDHGFGLGEDQPATSALMKKEFRGQLIYHLTPPEDVTLGGMLLREGPHKAIVSAKFEGGNDVDEVPRVYIKMTHDLVLKLEQQEAMVARFRRGVEGVWEIRRSIHGIIVLARSWSRRWFCHIYLFRRSIFME